MMRTKCVLLLFVVVVVVAEGSEVPPWERGHPESSQQHGFHRSFAPQSFVEAQSFAQHAPPSQTYGGQGRWAPPPPQQLRKRRLIAPYRMVTKASVSGVFLLLAWHASMLRQELASETGILGWTFAHAALQWANLASCFLVPFPDYRKVLQVVLAADVALEAHLALACVSRAFPRPGGPPVPDGGFASLWFGMLAFTAFKSKWINAAPLEEKTPPSAAAAYRRMQQQQQQHRPPPPPPPDFGGGSQQPPPWSTDSESS